MTGVGWAELKKPAHPLTPQMQRCHDLGLLDDLFGDRTSTWDLCTPFTILRLVFRRVLYSEPWDQATKE